MLGELPRGEDVTHVVHGYPDGTFRPASPVTRAEFAKVVERSHGDPTPEYFDKWQERLR